MKACYRSELEVARVVPGEGWRFLRLAALVAAVALGVPASLPAADPPAKAPAAGNELDIHADLIESFWEKRQVIFTGHVQVADTRMDVQADKMTMLLTEQHQAQLIEAEGNVIVERQGAKVTSGKARYEVTEGIITLSEKPVVEQDGNRVVGAEEVVLNRKEARFFTRGGRPRLTIIQKPGTELNLPLPPGPNEKKAPEGAAVGPTEISANQMAYEQKDARAIFQGQVQMMDDRLNLAADKVTVRLSPESRIQHLLAEGQVSNTRDDRKATGGRAEYDLGQERVVLTETPVLVQPGVVVEGAQQVVFDRRAAKFETVGPTRVKIQTSDQSVPPGVIGPAVEKKP